MIANERTQGKPNAKIGSGIGVLVVVLAIGMNRLVCNPHMALRTVVLGDEDSRLNLCTPPLSRLVTAAYSFLVVSPSSLILESPRRRRGTFRTLTLQDTERGRSPRDSPSPVMLLRDPRCL